MRTFTASTQLIPSIAVHISLSNFTPQRCNHNSRNISKRATPEDASALLDSFWLARGVTALDQRRRLIDVGLAEEPNLLSPPPSSTATLPGASSAWFLDGGEGSVAEDVARISHRLLALQRLLGERADIDVVRMVEREPELLTTDLAIITQRLVTLVTAEGAVGLDVVKLVEAQPGLLLESGGELSGSGEESSAQMQLAWAHGLLGDNDVQFAKRLEELMQYKAVHGDVHVGFRDGDDPNLVRWASKQREEYGRGLLPQNRNDQLTELGFEFDSERAEWLRWFNQLAAFKAVEGHCNPMPLAAGSDFLLLNWCAVQRIGKRSRVMAADREEMLDSLGFDWTGADALS
jgi:hypothetical protein